MSILVYTSIAKKSVLSSFFIILISIIGLFPTRPFAGWSGALFIVGRGISAVPGDVLKYRESLDAALAVFDKIIWERLFTLGRSGAGCYVVSAIREGGIVSTVFVQ